MKKIFKKLFNTDNVYYIEQHEHNSYGSFGYIIYRNYIIFGVHVSSKVAHCTNEQLSAWLKYLDCTKENTTSNFELNFN